MEEKNNDNTIYTLSIVLFIQFISIYTVWTKGDSTGVLDFIFRSFTSWIGLTIIWALIFGVIKYLEKYHLLEKKLGFLYFLIAPFLLLLLYMVVNFI